MENTAISPTNCFICNLLKPDYDGNNNLGVPICTSCWSENSKDFSFYQNNREKFYPEIDQITDKVFLGNEDGQRDKENLKKLGITHILVVGNGLKIFHPKDFEYKNFKIADWPTMDIAQFFQEAFEFIEKSNKVFVHCAAGISRSATIVISYFMKKNNLSFEEAEEFVKFKRPLIYPNSGFVKQLQNYKPNN